MHKVIKDGNDWERCYINLQSCLQAQSRYTNTSQYFIVHTGNKVLLTIIDNVARIGNAVYYKHTFQALQSIPHTPQKIEDHSCRELLDLRKQIKWNLCTLQMHNIQISFHL